MFTSVSWNQYFTFLLIAGGLYYLFIWIFVFKAKVGFVSNLSKLPTSLHGEDAPDEMMTTAQHVIDELRGSFKPGLGKNELLYSLQQQLTKYSDWQESGFRETVNQYIREAFHQTCSIRLGEDEVRALWK